MLDITGWELLCFAVMIGLIVANAAYETGLRLEQGEDR